LVLGSSAFSLFCFCKECGFVLFHISGNFASEGQCGRCVHFILVGTCTGVCSKNNYEDRINTETCDKYEYGEPEYD
jgi:hypothetical protein